MGLRGLKQQEMTMEYLLDVAILVGLTAVLVAQTFFPPG